MSYEKFKDQYRNKKARPTEPDPIPDPIPEPLPPERPFLEKKQPQVYAPLPPKKVRKPKLPPKKPHAPFEIPEPLPEPEPEPIEKGLPSHKCRNSVSRASHIAQKGSATTSPGWTSYEASRQHLRNKMARPTEPDLIPEPTPESLPPERGHETNIANWKYRGRTDPQPQTMSFDQWLEQKAPAIAVLKDLEMELRSARGFRPTHRTTVWLLKPLDLCANLVRYEGKQYMISLTLTERIKALPNGEYLCSGPWGALGNYLVWLKNEKEAYADYLESLNNGESNNE
jgi:hypothetical protein